MLHDKHIYFGRYCFVSNRFCRLFINMACHHIMNRLDGMSKIELEAQIGRSEND